MNRKSFRMASGGAVASMAILLGCGSPPSSLSQLDDHDVVKFVHVDPDNSRRLTLDGQEFRFSGFNSATMLMSRESADRQFEKLAAVGANSLRMWGFWNNSEEGLVLGPGKYNEERWKIFDYVIAEAAKKKIRLIIPLANYWDEYGGIDVWNQWAGLDAEKKPYFDREEFYRSGEVKALFQRYVEYTLNRRNTLTGLRYREDPTIMMWEPINEARGRSDASGKSVAEWLSWSSALIKKNAPLQLVGGGDEGFFSAHGAYKDYPWQTGKPQKAKNKDGSVTSLDAEGSYFEQNCAIPTIDVCSIHAWPKQWFVEETGPGEFLKNWIDEHLETMSASFPKPLYLGEFGYAFDRSEDKDGKEMATRNDVIKNAFFTAGDHPIRSDLVGALIWKISEGSATEAKGSSNDIICPEDKESCAIIRDFNKEQLGLKDKRR